MLDIEIRADTELEAFSLLVFFHSVESCYAGSQGKTAIHVFLLNSGFGMLWYQPSDGTAFQIFMFKVRRGGTHL